jgi:hypothetical protein
MLLHTSAVKLGMPLYISHDELLFDLRNELDQICGFEISESTFTTRILNSVLFKSSEKRYPGPLNEQNLEKKMCYEPPAPAP